MPNRTPLGFEIVPVGFQETGDTTNLDPALTNLSSTADLRVGMTVTGTNVPASTTIISIDSGTQVTMSQDATGSGAGITFTFYGRCWLTPPRGASVARLINEGASIRWRDDGTEPSLTDGMLMTTTQALTYDANLAAIRFYQASAATTSTLSVTYYDGADF